MTIPARTTRVRVHNHTDTTGAPLHVMVLAGGGQEVGVDAPDLDQLEALAQRQLDAIKDARSRSRGQTVIEGFDSPGVLDA